VLNTEVAYFINVGMKKRDITVEVDDNGKLCISGERVKKRLKNQWDIRIQERIRGKFKREFPLPPNVSAADITAIYHNGILRVAIPKYSTTTRSAPRKIPVIV